MLGLLGIPAGLAILDWLALVRRWRWVDFIAKPGVILALVLWSFVVLDGRPAEPASAWFVSGLLFSVLGDVFLMLPRERFTAGLGAFLLAHVCYTAAFASRGLSSERSLILAAALVLLVAAFLLRRLRQSLVATGQSKLWLPVVLYALVISVMLLAGLQAMVNPRWQRNAAALLTLGALLFYASDALLAWNKFVKPVPRGQLIVRILYHGGQILLTASFFYHRLAV